MFSPESQYAADIYNQNYQGQLAARTATAKNRASMIGAGIGAFGKMTGSSVAAGKGMFGGLFGG